MADVPFLGVGRFPSADQGNLSLISSSLHELENWCRQFEAALHLWDLVDDNIEKHPPPDGRYWIMTNWRFLAARDGAMSLNHFRIALEGLHSLVRRVILLAPHVDLRAINSAKKKFRESFPDCEAVRNAIAHIAEKTVDPVRSATHRTKTGFRTERATIEWTGVSIGGMIEGRIYRTNYQGRIVSYPFHGGTLGIMANVRDEVYSAFGQVLDAEIGLA